MVNTTSSSEILRRIQEADQIAASAISPFIPGAMKDDFELGDDPVGEADRVVNEVLRDVLVRDGEGWLSEESADDLTRLKKTRVWVVDPIDRTREFAAGIPESCISIGFIENGQAIACGICNPATGETFLGSLGSGVTYNGNETCASRSEVKRETGNGSGMALSR
jgi:myo-inositol-1(or 4)-monophosphatase